MQIVVNCQTRGYTLRINDDIARVLSEEEGMPPSFCLLNETRVRYLVHAERRRRPVDLKIFKIGR